MNRARVRERITCLQKCGQRKELLRALRTVVLARIGATRKSIRDTFSGTRARRNSANFTETASVRRVCSQHRRWSNDEWSPPVSSRGGLPFVVGMVFSSVGELVGRVGRLNDVRYESIRTTVEDFARRKEVACESASTWCLKCRG